MSFDALARHPRKVGVRCYDNGGDTADRYTAVITGRYRHLTFGRQVFLGMSSHPYHPQGVGTYGDSLGSIDCPSYVHLGKKITFDKLPKDCKRLVMDYIFDLAY